MRSLACLVFALTILGVSGCGRAGLAGNYRAEIRLVQGKPESTERGYSLAEVKARAGQRTLTLHPNGRYEWRSSDYVNEGNWRVEGDAFIMRDDTSNGNRVLPALQKDRRWRVDGGEIVNEGSYSRYNLEEVYTRAK